MTEPRTPVAVVFGGGIGVGKTTLFHRLLTKPAYRDLSCLPMISADAFPDDQPHAERSRQAEHALEVAMDTRQAFVWEATFGWSPSSQYGVGELETRWLKQLRNVGFHICFHGILAPNDVVWRRIKARELASGRVIDADWRIDESSELFLRNVPAIRACCNRFRLWSNTTTLRPIAD